MDVNRSHRSLVGFNPFFGRDIESIVDFFDFSSGLVDLSFSWNLDFNMFLDNSGFGSEQNNWLTDLDVIIGEQEGSDNRSLVS